MKNEFYVKNPETGEMVKDETKTIIIDEKQLVDDIIASKEQDMLDAYKEIERLKELKEGE